MGVFSQLKEYLPRNQIDALAMAMTFILIPLAYFHGVVNIAPIVWPIQDVPDELRETNLVTHYASILFMTFLFVNAMANLFLTMVVNTTCGRVALPVVTQPGWRFCPYCQHYSPPRAHHCSLCKKCILRRDHHCYFTGKCVGHYNQRYFVAFLIYVLVAALFGVFLSFRAISILQGGLSWNILPSLIFPVVVWVLQMMPVSPLVLIETSVAMFTALGTGALLFLQLCQIYSGQTLWEFQRKVSKYNGGLRRNMVDAMGYNWWFCWLLPFIRSPQPGDGSHYPPLDDVTPHTESYDITQDRRRKPVKSL